MLITAFTVGDVFSEDQEDMTDNVINMNVSINIIMNVSIKLSNVIIKFIKGLLIYKFIYFEPNLENSVVTDYHNFGMATCSLKLLIESYNGACLSVWLVRKARIWYHTMISLGKLPTLLACMPWPRICNKKSAFKSYFIRSFTILIMYKKFKITNL